MLKLRPSPRIAGVCLRVGRIHIKPEPLSPQRPAVRRGQPMSSRQGQGSSAAAPAPATCNSRSRKAKRSRTATPAPSPAVNQRRSSFQGTLVGGVSAVQVGAALAAEIHGRTQQQSAPLPGFPHAPSGPSATAASKAGSAAPTGAGKQGNKRRNAKEIAALVEQRRAALRVRTLQFPVPANMVGVKQRLRMLLATLESNSCIDQEALVLHDICSWPIRWRLLTMLACLGPRNSGEIDLMQYLHPLLPHPCVKTWHCQ